MLLPKSPSTSSFGFVLALTSIMSACGTKDDTSGDPITWSGGNSSGIGGSGAPAGGTASGGTGTVALLTGGTQSMGGASLITGGQSGVTSGGGTGTSTGGKTSGGANSGGQTPGGTTSSGTNLGGAVTGGTRSTGGGSNDTAAAGAVAGGTGTTTTSKASGGSSGGGSSSGGSGGGATGGSTFATTGGRTPTGGTSSSGAGTAGTANSTGGTGEGGSGTGGSGTQFTIGACTLGAGTQEGSGQTEEQYFGANVTRNGVNYKMITNGWGQGWISHDISWLGTSMNIEDYQGTRQSNGAPAGFPTVFCGRYSDTSLECGLPRALASITALNTAVSWTHPAGDGKYNASYDVWLGDGAALRRGLQSYFMVWLHDPIDEQPAGSLTAEGVTVANVPGTWNIVTGTVNNLPIVNYVRAEGDDTHQIAFDIMDFIRDAQTRNFNMPGNDVLAVAFGFEIWSGPVTNLSLDDFCLDIE